MLAAPNLSRMAKSGRPSLEDEEADRVRDGIRQLLPRFSGNLTALGRELGVSQPALTQILNGNNSPSLPTARRVAQLLQVPIWA